MKKIIVFIMLLIPLVSLGSKNDSIKMLKGISIFHLGDSFDSIRSNFDSLRYLDVGWLGTTGDYNDVFEIRLDSADMHNKKNIRVLYLPHYSICEDIYTLAWYLVFKKNKLVAIQVLVDSTMDDVMFTWFGQPEQDNNSYMDKDDSALQINYVCEWRNGKIVARNTEIEFHSIEWSKKVMKDNKLLETLKDEYVDNYNYLLIYDKYYYPLYRKLLKNYVIE